jgi:hypothetical protein
MTLKVGYDVFKGAAQAGTNDGTPGVVQAEVDTNAAYYMRIQRLSDNFYWNNTTLAFQAAVPSQSNEILIQGSDGVVGTSGNRRLSDRIPYEALSGMNSSGCKITVYPDGGNVDLPASKVTGSAPFNLAPGDTVVMDVDNVGAATATFDAAAGYQDDTTTWPVTDPGLNGKSFDITLDGGSAQTISIVDTGDTTLQEAINQINEQLVGGLAMNNGSDQLRVKSDKKGTGSSVDITVGSSGLTVAAAVPGTGDAADITAVTIAELKTVIEADTAASVSDNGDGTATIVSPTEGDDSELDFQSGNAVTKLGLSVEVVNGTTAADGCSITLEFELDA